MKAKDYAALYRVEVANGREKLEALVIVLHNFTLELGKLTEARGCQSNSAVLACFKEIEQKYHAFSRLAADENTDIKFDGFRVYLKNIHPELWDVIQVLIWHAEGKGGQP